MALKMKRESKERCKEVSFIQRMFEFNIGGFPVKFSKRGETDVVKWENR